MADDQSKTRQSTAAWPNIDISELLERFRLPGIDVDKFIDQHRANIEAVQEANRIALEGWQSLLARQAEMMREAVETWQKDVADGLKSPDQAISKQVEVAQQAMEKALANMRELAEMASKSQRDAAEVVSKRFQENLDSLRKQLQPKD